MSSPCKIHPVIEALLRFTVLSTGPDRTLTCSPSKFAQIYRSMPDTWRWVKQDLYVPHLFFRGYTILPFAEPYEPSGTDYFHVACGTFLFRRNGPPYRSGDRVTGHDVVLADGTPPVWGTMLTCPTCERYVPFDPQELRHVES